jgi:hypothetical protein
MDVHLPQVCSRATFFSVAFISAHSRLPSWEIGGAENKEIIEGEQILRTNID